MITEGNPDGDLPPVRVRHANVPRYIMPGTAGAPLLINF